MKNIFIIGSKGIPSRYGGFETFVDKLTEYKKSSNIKYHVACLSNNDNEFEYNNARCFNVKTPNVGSAKAIIYDIKALDKVYKYIKKNKLNNSIVYILACRVGPFMRFYKKRFMKLGISIYLNPDGHEWKRAKWSKIVRRYWKASEKMMIKHSNLIICDSLAIESYIKNEYKKMKPNTTYIAYGATVNQPVNSSDEKYKLWLQKWNLQEQNYYLIVGRMVPENNYELIIREFLTSNTTKSLVIVTEIQDNTYYEKLKQQVPFENDSRIKFVGTIYDQDLLFRVRSSAFAYLHGHEVGGTNPSLLEALATTQLNILLNVSFNKEVGTNAALYFDKTSNDLAKTIEYSEALEQQELVTLSDLAKARIKNKYSWEIIVDRYEVLFARGVNK